MMKKMMAEQTATLDLKWTATCKTMDDTISKRFDDQERKVKDIRGEIGTVATTVTSLHARIQTLEGKDSSKSKKTCAHCCCTTRTRKP